MNLVIVAVLAILVEIPSALTSQPPPPPAGQHQATARGAAQGHVPPSTPTPARSAQQQHTPPPTASIPQNVDVTPPHHRIRRQLEVAVPVARSTFEAPFEDEIINTVVNKEFEIPNVKNTYICDIEEKNCQKITKFIIPSNISYNCYEESLGVKFNYLTVQTYGYLTTTKGLQNKITLTPTGGKVCKKIRRYLDYFTI